MDVEIEKEEELNEDMKLEEGADDEGEEDLRRIVLDEEKVLGGLELGDMIAVSSEEEMKHLIWHCVEDGMEENIKEDVKEKLLESDFTARTNGKEKSLCNVKIESREEEMLRKVWHFLKQVMEEEGSWRRKIRV